MAAGQSKKVREWDRIIMRVPDGMRAELDAIAAEECRPLNGQLLFMIKGAIEARKTASSASQG